MFSGKITNSVCLQLITSNINQKLHHNYKKLIQRCKDNKKK
nr:MAG TPA: hypothetical protein [Caudoviricetes sp.]